ncbi:peroxisomal targeting signal 1 receptor [Coprinopsis sp. MPI-PUGE-AT-0042]|nr:peroxisomal targeting signal 1 receptor [Coprinopsis sp. MPI-PUGE-AT-0042]
MALPMLVGGTDCGPSNPLQNLSKRFEQDRGAQQDFYGAGRAGSSRESFRSQQAGPSTADQDAARFFSATTSGPGQLSNHSDSHFDLSALHQALPIQQQPSLHGPSIQQANAPAGWAADFMMSAAGPMDALHAPMQKASQQQQVQQVQQQQHNVPAHAPQMGMQQGWNPGMSAFRMNSMNQVPGFMPQMQTQSQAQGMTTTSKRISWDKEFSALDLNLASEPLVQQQQQQQQIAEQKRFEGDDLAKTAGMLLDHVRHEQNPKFQKSQFLGLMRQLRDGEVIVEGNQMVESDGTRTSSAANPDVKGKGRAFDPIPSTSTMRQTIQQQQQQSGEGRMEEDANDAYFREENEEYARYWNQSDKARFDVPRGAAMSEERAGWDRLQEDWDRFEATTTGIKQVNNYQFQASNPYLLGESSRTRQHEMHNGRQSVFESILELEAAVQRDTTNAGLWYELGVRQQENEREHKALSALQRAVELDPTHLPAWLALGISYTNDGNRQGTYDAISEWVNRNETYAGAVEAFKASHVQREEGITNHERFARLIECLIAMARSDLGSGAGEVDADIQIALAVLLNTNEEYEKAQDCFRTALAVRPEDWLLYNRVGATMANSGRAEEALQYYYRALELNPTYIRARFNLGISCINLRRYEEAAQHILDALLLQDSESTMDSTDDKKGVVSNALWDSLKTTCLHMQRADLAMLCDLKDIDGFRKRFYG